LDTTRKPPVPWVQPESCSHGRMLRVWAYVGKAKMVAWKLSENPVARIGAGVIICGCF
jgi:hypothetical protein